MRMCNHDEIRLGSGSPVREVGGTRTPLVLPLGWTRHHDCAYVDARNALIPSAEKVADRELAKHMETDAAKREAGTSDVARESYKRLVWSRLFIEAMDRLWRERN